LRRLCGCEYKARRERSGG
jgi:hypothetical protein